MNKSEEESNCEIAVSGLDEEKKNHVAGLTYFQSELRRNKVPKAKSISDSQNQKETCEFQLMQSEENLMHSHHKTFLSSQDTFTFKITNFLKLPMIESYFIDSTEFSFANTTWCLRIYPNGKKGNHEGWVHLLLVQLQPSNSRHQIYYRLGLKVQDKELHESFTHVITHPGNMSEVGIINPLQRLDVVSHLNKCAQNSFLKAFCEIKVELSKSADAFETSSEYQTEKLAKQSQKLCLPLAISCKEAFIWEIKKFFELPMKEGYFFDSETFSVANAVWCLRIYPNGHNNLNPGWIHLLLIRLQPSSSQQCIQYRLGLKMKGNKEYGTLTHAITFHENCKETGVVNLIKRSNILSMKKKFARNGVLRVFCQVSSLTVDSTSKPIQLEPPYEISLVKKLENSSVGVLEEIPYLGAKDVIWKIPFFVIEPMQVGHWMDSPAFSFLNESWCLRFYMKQKKIGNNWQIYMYLVRFNTCSFMYLITYELSILDSSGLTWLKFRKHNCQGIHQSHVMKLGISKLYFPPDGFVALYFQMLSKEGFAEASKLTHKPRHHLEFPLNDVELYGPSLFRHGMLFERPVVAATEIMWKIPDFFQLRKAVVNNIISPVFEFGNDTWLLQLYPNDTEDTSGRMSFVLSRLFASITKQHIICHFSIRDSSNTISRCKLEEVFEGSSKSIPVHLELSKIMNKLEANITDGILTVFCQMHILRENVDTEHPEPMTRDPSNVSNQLHNGLLFQQSFSAVANITWKISNFHSFKRSSNFINSPVFNLDNDTWVLQLYPNGYETRAEKISIILVRLFPSDINHHIFCTFSVKDTNIVVDGKGSCENTFKDKNVKSSPVHFKKIKSMKKQEDDPNDLLTVFCQMYVIENKKAVLQTSPESVHLEEIEVLSLDDIRQFIHGALIQQLFLAATEIIWKIPEFLRLIKKQDEFVNSPVFGLANDTWLLQLYLEGNESSMRKIYCILVRLFHSNLERNVIWKISIKNEKNMIIESGTCESTFGGKITKSCPIYLEPSKIMDNVRENMSQDVLMLFCQMYIIDDNKETVIKASSQINQVKSMTNENFCEGDIVILKENEDKSNFPQGFQNKSQDFISKGEGNVWENEKDFRELDSTLLKEKKKDILLNQIDAEHALLERNGKGNLPNEDPCIGDMLILKENKNKSDFAEGIQNNTQDIISKKEGSVLENERDVDIFWDELDFTHLKKKKKKKKTFMSQLEAEHLIREKENEGNLAKNDDQCTSDMVVSKENRSKSHFFKEFQNDTQDLFSKKEGNVLENEKDIDTFCDELDFTRLKKKKKKNVMNQLEGKQLIPEKENEGNIAENEDQCTIDIAISKEDENKSIVFEEFPNNVQDLVSEKQGKVLENEKDIDVYRDDLTHLKKENVVMDQLEYEHPLQERCKERNIARISDKSFKDSEEVPPCEKGYVKFLVRGEEIRANLSAFKEKSTVFQSFIQHDIREVSNTVVIEDCDPQIFKAFLLYLSTQQVDTLTSENVYRLYTLASKYGIHKLKTECLEYIKYTISVDTVCDIMAFSFQQKDNEILELTTAFFFKNEPEITSSTKWQIFLKENSFANQLLETVLKK